MLEYNGGSPEPYGVCRKRKKKPTEVCCNFLHMDFGRDFDDWSKVFHAMKDKKAPVFELIFAFHCCPTRLGLFAREPGDATKDLRIRI